VVNAIDVPSIFDLPTLLHDQHLDRTIVHALGLDTLAGDVDWSRWQSVLDAVHHPKGEVTVAIVGKYVDLPDAYLSFTSALAAGGFAHTTTVNLKWVAAADCETAEGARAQLSDVHAICVPGGFGQAGVDGKLEALTFARQNRIPTLGICLGMQTMVIEYARNVAGLTGASSTEFDAGSDTPVIQVAETSSGADEGQMRLGLYEAQLTG